MISNFINRNGFIPSKRSKMKYSVFERLLGIMPMQFIKISK